MRLIALNRVRLPGQDQHRGVFLGGGGFLAVLTAGLVGFVVLGASPEQGGNPPTPPAAAPLAVPVLTNGEPVVVRQFAEARSALEKVLARPESPTRLAEAWIQYGKLHLAYRLLDRGGACFTNAVVAAPAHAMSWYGLALGRLEQERMTDGLQALTNALKCLKADPGSPPSAMGDVRRMLGDTLDRAGRLEEALAQFDAEHLGEPSDAYSPLRATQVLLRLGRTAEARQRLERLHRAIPGNMNVRALLAETVQRLGATNEARKLRLPLPAGQWPRLVRPDAWIKEVSELNISSAVRIQAGQVLMQSRRFRSALQKFEALLEVDRTNIAARTFAASCRLQLKDYAAARSTFQQLVKEEPGLDLARTGLAIATARLGDKPKALALCREWLEKETNSVAALFSDVEVRRVFKDYEGALPSLMRLTNLEPESVGHVRALANTQAAAGKGAAAAETLRARVSQPKSPWELSLQLLRLIAASRETAVRNPAVALQGVEFFLGQYGTNVLLGETLALALAGNGRWSEAEDVLEGIQPKVEAMRLAQARAGEGTEEAPDTADLTARYDTVRQAVGARMLYLESWPFAPLEESRKAVPGAPSPPAKPGIGK